MRDLLWSKLKLPTPSALSRWAISFSSIFQRTYTLRAVAGVFILPEPSHGCGRRNHIITGAVPQSLSLPCKLGSGVSDRRYHSTQTLVLDGLFPLPLNRAKASLTPANVSQSLSFALPIFATHHSSFITGSQSSQRSSFPCNSSFIFHHSSLFTGSQSPEGSSYLCNCTLF